MLYIIKIIVSYCTIFLTFSRQNTIHHGTTGSPRQTDLCRGVSFEVPQFQECYQVCLYVTNLINFMSDLGLQMGVGVHHL